MNVQSILFQKSKWTLNEARKWLRKHKYKTSVHTTTNYYRFRQIKPDPKAKYFIQRLPNGILLTITK